MNLRKFFSHLVLVVASVFFLQTMFLVNSLPAYAQDTAQTQTAPVAEQILEQTADQETTEAVDLVKQQFSQLRQSINEKLQALKGEEQTALTSATPEDYTKMGAKYKELGKQIGAQYRQLGLKIADQANQVGQPADTAN